MIDEKRLEIIHTPRSVITHLVNCNSAVFYRAVQEGYEIVDFITKFMRSEVAKILDLHLNYYRWEGPPSLYQDFLDECSLWAIPLKIETRDNLNYYTLREAALWAGFIYRLAHFKTGDSSAELVDFMPPALLLQAYPTGHCQDPDQWIEDYYWNHDLAKYIEIFGLNDDGGNNCRPLKY